MKSLMGKVLTERNEACNKIMLQLDDMQLHIRGVDHKVSLLAGLDFLAVNDDQPQVLDYDVNHIHV
jgi:hypothetical protein